MTPAITPVVAPGIAIPATEVAATFCPTAVPDAFAVSATISPIYPAIDTPVEAAIRTPVSASIRPITGYATFLCGSETVAAPFDTPFDAPFIPVGASLDPIGSALRTTPDVICTTFTAAFGTICPALAATIYLLSAAFAATVNLTSRPITTLTFRPVCTAIALPFDPVCTGGGVTVYPIGRALRAPLHAVCAVVASSFDAISAATLWSAPHFLISTLSATLTTGLATILPICATLCASVLTRLFSRRTGLRAGSSGRFCLVSRDDEG